MPAFGDDEESEGKGFLEETQKRMRVAERGQITQEPFVYYIMLFIDVIMLIVVLWAYIWSRNADVVPWKVGLFDIENDTLIKKSIKEYTALSWSATTSDVAIIARVDKLKSDMYFDRAYDSTLVAEAPFLTCVHVASAALVGLFRKEETTNDEGAHDLRAAMWQCSRMYDVPRSIKRITTIDVLLCLLIWCAHSAATRAFALYTSPIGKGPKRIVMLGTVVFTTTLALAIFGYSMYYATNERADFALGLVLLMLIALGGLVTSGVIAFQGGAVAVSEMKNIGLNKTMSFNPTWVILCLLKPLVVAPLFTLLVVVLTGVVEIYSIIIIFFLAICFSLMSSVLAFYNLADTYYKTNGFPAKSFLTKLNRHPSNTILICVIIISTICFLPWPRRTDDPSLWDSVFGSFILFAGLLCMVMPDIVFQFGAANAVRELSETMVRIIVTAGMLYGVW